jgi:hypothetical protein
MPALAHWREPRKSLKRVKRSVASANSALHNSRKSVRSAFDLICGLTI